MHRITWLRSPKGGTPGSPKPKGILSTTMKRTLAILRRYDRLLRTPTRTAISLDKVIELYLQSIVSELIAVDISYIIVYIHVVYTCIYFYDIVYVLHILEICRASLRLSKRPVTYWQLSRIYWDNFCFWDHRESLTICWKQSQKAVHRVIRQMIGQISIIYDIIIQYWRC